MHWTPYVVVTAIIERVRCVDDYLAGKRYPLEVLYHLPFYP